MEFRRVLGSLLRPLPHSQHPNQHPSQHRSRQLGSYPRGPTAGQQDVSV
jgi:hypothetical protein